MDSNDQLYDFVQFEEGINTQQDCKTKCLDIGDNSNLVGYSLVTGYGVCYCFFTDNSITDAPPFIDLTGEGPVDDAEEVSSVLCSPQTRSSLPLLVKSFYLFGSVPIAGGVINIMGGGPMV